MKRVWPIIVGILGAGAFVVAVIVLFYLCDPEANERRAKKTALASLLARHASLEEVTNTLRLSFQDNSAGTTNRAGFEAWMVREHHTMYNPIREGAARYPRVYYHTTMWTMTWLFFDAEGKLQKYYLCAQ